MEGSGAIEINYESECGSRIPKNIWILWIRIWMRIRNTAKNRSDKTKSDSEVYSICRVLPYPEDPNKESNGEESTDEADDDVSDLQDPRPFKFNLGGRLQNKENTKFENVRNKHNGQ
jgi:hypothetical protein